MPNKGGLASPKPKGLGAERDGVLETGDPSEAVTEKGRFNKGGAP